MRGSPKHLEEYDNRAWDASLDAVKKRLESVLSNAEAPDI